MRKKFRFMLSIGLMLWGVTALAQVPPGSPDFYTDPKTGITYRKVTQSIERPVIDQQTTTQERTTYQPQVVTTVRDEQRTIYTPVVRYEWEPKWHGRWNPFSQPTLAYHLVPHTQWQMRQETVQTPQTTTQWIAKQETVQIPSRVMRMERTTEFAYQPVHIPPTTFAPRPAMPSQVAVQSVAAPRIAEGPGRTSVQTGMRATVLGDAANPGIIASSPRVTVWR